MERRVQLPFLPEQPACLKTRQRTVTRSGLVIGKRHAWGLPIKPKPAIWQPAPKPAWHQRPAVMALFCALMLLLLTLIGIPLA